MSSPQSNPSSTISSESTLKPETKSLNQSGAFLQIHIINQLRAKKWDTVVEFPVRATPFNEDPKTHPLMYRQLLQLRYFSAKVFAKTISLCRNYAFLEESSIDIIAVRTIGNKIFKLCIEVKKLNPKYTDWCFIQQKPNYDPYRVIVSSKDKKGLVPLFTVPHTDLLREEISLQFEKFNKWLQTNFTVSDFGVALYEKQIRPEFYASEKTVVDQAARQIIMGTYELTIEALIHRVEQGNGLSPDVEEIFIPIVVTNANLLHCKFDPSNIDSITGIMNIDPEYDKVYGIIYECPTPKVVQYPDTLSRQLNATERKYTGKWHVLVLSPEGLNHLLNSIEATEMD